MHLDYDENGKYSKNRVPLVDLKRVMTEWQDKMYENDGWNSLYWSNHDQARAVSRFGNDSEKYRVISNYEDAVATVTDELVLPPYGAYVYWF